MPKPKEAPRARRPGIRRCLHLLGLSLAFLALASCGRHAGPGWNVVLVSIDTLRADHLGCDGYPRDTTPNLDRFSRRSVVFRQAIAQAPSTLPSHASILTSLLPQEHGASFPNRRPLAESFVTLPELLLAAGYQTASFNGGGQVASIWGLDQGFERYESLDGDAFAETVDRTFDWLDTDRTADRPFFLFLHSFEVHHPYTPSQEDRDRFVPEDRVAASWVGPSVEMEELRQINKGLHRPSPADEEAIVGEYDGEIRSMDRAFGRLVAGLEKRHLLERTLVVFTSDHGEELGEHGRWGWHSHTLYDELLHVPLIMAFPDGTAAGREVAPQVRSIDIAPTILDALGLSIPSELRGRSLLGLARGEPTPPLIAVSMRDQPDSEGAPFTSVRTERWKLIDGALYDLRQDPGETGRRLVDRLDVSLRLQKILENANGLVDRQREEGVTLDPETQKRLEALGYL